MREPAPVKRHPIFRPELDRVAVILDGAIKIVLAGIGASALGEDFRKVFGVHAAHVDQTRASQDRDVQIAAFALRAMLRMILDACSLPGLRSG